MEEGDREKEKEKGRQLLINVSSGWLLLGQCLETSEMLVQPAELLTGWSSATDLTLVSAAL